MPNKSAVHALKHVFGRKISDRRCPSYKIMSGWYKNFSIYGCSFCARSQVLVAKYSDVNTAFRAIDKDKSGKITPKELLDAVYAADLPLSQPDQVHRRING